jgi:hypothetical protein
MFQVGQTVMIRHTKELVQVKEVKFWGGSNFYICSREGTEDRSYVEGSLADPFGGEESEPPLAHE